MAEGQGSERDLCSAFFLFHNYMHFLEASLIATPSSNRAGHFLHHTSLFCPYSYHSLYVIMCCHAHFSSYRHTSGRQGPSLSQHILVNPGFLAQQLVCKRRPTRGTTSSSSLLFNLYHNSILGNTLRASLPSLALFHTVSPPNPVLFF